MLKMYYYMKYLQDKDDDLEPSSSCAIEDMQSAGEQTSLIEE